MILAQDAPEKVGDYTFTVTFAPETPENKERFERRAETFAALLLALWEREQLRRLAERN